MSAGTDTTKHENGVGAGPQGPETGFLPRIGVRGRLSAGIDGIRWHAGYFQRNDRVWLRCVRNHHGLMKATYGDENGLAPGTGNHKGCPYDGFVGAYFHSNDRSWVWL